MKPPPSSPTPREDMVIRPRLTGTLTKPQAQAQGHRAVEHAKSKHGYVGRFVRTLMQRTAARAGAAASRAVRAPTSAAGLTSGALVGAAVIAALVIGRLASGRTFENMGAELNGILLGDVTPEVMAKQATRLQMQSHENIMAIAGRGGITTQMRAMGARLYEVNLLAEKGKQAFDRDSSFQVNGMLDSVILSARNKLLEKWHGLGGDQATIDLRNAIRIRQLGGIYK